MVTHDLAVVVDLLLVGGIAVARIHGHEFCSLAATVAVTIDHHIILAGLLLFAYDDRISSILLASEHRMIEGTPPLPAAVPDHTHPGGSSCCRNSS